MAIPMRSLMYVPGNKQNLIEKAVNFGADVLVLDLEDSVPPAEKAAARATVEGVIKSGFLKDHRVVVRINGLDTAEASLDVKAMVMPGVFGLRIPKVETVGEIRELDSVVTDLEKHAGLEKGTIKFLAILESPLGVLRAYDIATSSPRMLGLTFGAEDFCVGMGVERSREGIELRYAREHIALCANAAGIMAFDTVFSDTKDEEGLVAETRYIKQLGFSGKSAIHPKQIEPIHRVFTPTPEELEKARRIVEAFEKAKAEGSGTVAVDGKMVDIPVVLRAQKILARAGEA